jgi:transcriptional regulator with XRE-family HTH domain
MGEPVTVKHIGRILRAARAARGLTLRQAANLSRGEFPPTSIASYERGDRSISLERFLRLASLYGMAPDRLLAAVGALAEGRPADVVRPAALRVLRNPAAETLAGFVARVAALRGAEPREAVAVRAGDLEVLATASGMPAAEFRRAIEPALEEGRPAAGSTPDERAVLRRP